MSAAFTFIDKGDVHGVRRWWRIAEGWLFSWEAAWVRARPVTPFEVEMFSRLAVSDHEPVPLKNEKKESPEP